MIWVSPLFSQNSISFSFESEKSLPQKFPLISPANSLTQLKLGLKTYIETLNKEGYLSASVDSISGDSSKFFWIPNGIDETLLEQESLTDAITDRIPKNKFVIGYTGTMGMANALEYLIESAVELKNNDEIHFVLVGDGYLKDELQSKVEENNNVTFIEKINKNQVQAMLQHFSVCFVGRNNTPLFDYGVSSNKFFDYMLAKKPVISSSNKIKDPVELSGCGFVVDPENSSAISEAILNLKQLSDKERDSLGLKGFQFVKKYHNYDYLSDKYIELFD